MLTVIDNLPRTGTCELMCHPGHEDAASRYFEWQYSWADELSAMVNPEVAEAIRRRGIKLISYRDLAAT
jgi:predicted glycoside hydrolase/deacetylase ChbG (UPF0249 family)